jgi:hypothetical protein
MFEAIFCPSSGAKERIFYSMCFSAPELLPGGGLESRGADCVFGVEAAAPSTPKTQSAPWLSRPPEDGQKIARNMLNWLNINKSLLLHLVGLPHYSLFLFIFQTCDDIVHVSNSY